ncbi:hypothetical protein Enr13x_74890 [Stieleria neptunia]|uniref:Uncharacterized protein n=1 Tax=Stieleria neptunia TaxID=2527979 RepID=A0A518I399_9BACT|nr:hypothetical protein Enr13x_74890 [Stieleria neptunia]
MVSKAVTAPIWQSLAIVLFALTGVVGCRSPQPYCDPGLPSRELTTRTGVTPQTVLAAEQMIPPGGCLG